MNGKTLGYIGLILVIAYWAYAIIDIAARDDGQWDFKTYYYAAKVHESGGDPYDVTALNQVAPEKIALPYVYPPLTIYFFRFFALFDWETAYQLWLWLKVLIGIALILIWRKIFYDGGSLSLFLLFALLAFSSAPYWDLLTGNVSMVEQLLLWLGFLFFVRRKSLPFAVMIVLASLFKFTYLSFLVLLVGIPRTGRNKAAIVGIVGAVGYWLTSYIINPAQFSSFIKLVRLINEGGAEYNHSLLAFLSDGAKLAAAAAQSKIIPDWLVFAAYALLALLGLTIAVKAWNRFAKTNRSDSIQMVIFVCLTYAVIAPRMKSYTYILLILPAYFVVREYTKAHALLLVFMLMSLTKWTPLPTIDAVRLLWWHYPWLLALLSWILMLRHLRSETEAKPQSIAAT